MMEEKTTILLTHTPEGMQVEISGDTAILCMMGANAQRSIAHAIADALCKKFDKEVEKIG